MHEAAVEEVVGRGIGVGFVEAPPWLAFRVWAYDGDGEDGCEVFEVTDEVGAMCEGAEKALRCQSEDGRSIG